MLVKDDKTKIITEYATKEGDTGSPEVQVALLTTRINQLTEHLRVHKHVPGPHRAARSAPLTEVEGSACGRR